MSVCLYACLSVDLSVCLAAYLPACLPVGETASRCNNISTSYLYFVIDNDRSFFQYLSRAEVRGVWKMQKLLKLVLYLIFCIFKVGNVKYRAFYNFLRNCHLVEVQIYIFTKFLPFSNRRCQVSIFRLD